MAVFIPGVPVETADPQITVEGLPPGAHNFRLVVADEDGNLSEAAFARITVNPKDERIDPKVIRVEKLAQPFDADHDPIGKELWVSANEPATAAGSGAFAMAISLADGKLAGSVAVPARAGDIAVSRTADRRVGLVANPGARAATVIGLGQRERLKVFQLKDDPDGVAVSPDGTRGLVAIPATGQVIVLDLIEFRVLGELEVGRLPSKIRLAQAGKLAFVNCLGTGEIVGIDVRKPAVVGRFAVGGGGQSLPVQFTATEAGFPVWTADQQAAMASFSASASKVRDIRLDLRPGAVAADEGGKRAFLAGPESDRLAICSADSDQAVFAQMPAPAGGYKSVAALRDGSLAATIPYAPAMAA